MSAEKDLGRLVWIIVFVDHQALSGRLDTFWMPAILSGGKQSVQDEVHPLDTSDQNGVELT